ncbi:hypothetical protein D3C81_1410950 [compost metagenome]
MAVVAADVVLLRGLAVQQAAGLQEELLDANVRRQAVVAQVGEVGELFVVSEYALNERLKKAPLQAIAQRRAAQAQRGVDRQLALRQVADPRIQGVDEGVGFAQAQWQAHVDVGRQAGQHLLDGLVDGAAMHLGLLSRPWVQGLDTGFAGLVACSGDTKTKPAKTGGPCAIQR